MRHERLLLIAVALLAGCGGGLGATNTGVRQRVVATVPTEQIAVLPAQPPRAGHVRLGVAGGVPFVHDRQTPRAAEGARFEPVGFGEAYVAVGMPGTYRALDRDVRAGWELVGGVIAAPAPSSRALDSDPSLVVPDRSILGGSVGVTGAVGDRELTLAGSLTVRGLAVPFAWDYGDCAGGPDCPIWNRKGAPAEGVQHVMGVDGSIGVRKRMQAGLAFLVSGGFDVRPTFDVASRAAVMCDANGNCSGGRAPEEPEASHAGIAYGLVGLDAEPNQFSRFYIVVVPLTSGDERRIQVRLGMEARF